MVDICFYFQVHQPYRLRDYTIFDIGNSSSYFNEQKNREILKRVAEKCYLPTNKVIQRLLNAHPEFCVSYSFSGVVLEQFEEYAPEVLLSFQELVDTGRVEILDETYYHSLSFLYSGKEFEEQINMHRNKIRKLFNYKPTVFRNTELIYSNRLARFIEDKGYIGILAEGADHVLGWRSPNFVYRPVGTGNIKLLLKNYRLSDDIAFRFSSRQWKDYPLTADKFAQWVSQINGNGTCVNLFMDYETFGEHQWRDTGIFDFLNALPSEILRHHDNGFKTPCQIVRDYEPVGELDIHHVISWADVERDLSAWLGNKMQQSAISSLYLIEKEVLSTENPELIKNWRRLQTSDAFYYMCTKWFNDGDVHKYFNPYESPYDAFIIFMNILNDIKLRVVSANNEVQSDDKRKRIDKTC